MGTDQTTIGSVAALAERVTGRPFPTDPAVSLEAVGFDSLAFVELASVLESEREIVLPDIVLPRTVGDLVDLVDAARLAPTDPFGSRTTRPPVPIGLGRSQDLVRSTIDPLLRWFFHIEVEGASHMPARGPVIVSLNHDSAIDVLVTTIAGGRRLAVMGKAEVFLNRFVDWVFHELGSYPVDRDRWDRRAVEVSLALLDRGHAVAVWPEGTRAAHELLPFLPGAAWLALARGVPIVPGAIIGSGRAWPRDRKLPRRHRVKVVFGEPILVERVADPVERLQRARVLTDELRVVIERLLREGGSDLLKA